MNMKILAALLLVPVVGGQAAVVIPRLYSFSATNDGADPVAGLVQATDGNLYGTTSQSGVGGQGTVFQITTNGLLTTLVRFNGANGWISTATMIISVVPAPLVASVSLGQGNKCRVELDGRPAAVRDSNRHRTDQSHLAKSGFSNHQLELVPEPVPSRLVLSYPRQLKRINRFRVSLFENVNSSMKTQFTRLLGAPLGAKREDRHPPVFSAVSAGQVRVFHFLFARFIAPLAQASGISKRWATRSATENNV